MSEVAVPEAGGPCVDQPELGAQLVTGSPGVPLRPLIHRYIGYFQHALPITMHRTLPSRFVTLVISLADPIRMTAFPDGSSAPAAYRCCVGGLHASPGVVVQEHTQYGIHVQLEPLGARRLFGMPAGELTSTVVELAELVGGLAGSLAERLRLQPTWSDRFALLDRLLHGIVTRGGGTAGVGGRAGGSDSRREVDWAWHRLVRTGGTVPVGQLAADVGWSRRHFGELFRRELGLTPKQAGRVMRFERSTALLRRAQRVNLAELAAACGYHDQAHMTNEWRSLAGCTPGAWIAEELPFLQYEGDASYAELPV